MCVGCGAFDRYVCRDCEVGVWEEQQVCPGCGKESPNGVTHSSCRRFTELVGLTAIWAYEGLIKRLISDGKYLGYFDYFDYLARCAITKIKQGEVGLNGIECDVVVPVPMYIERLKTRGFNQAEIVARLIGRYLGKPVRLAISRSRDTGQQVGRKKEERRVALKHAFEVNTTLSGERIILVDDVWTTGTTLNECAITLRKAGSGKIWGFVLAR